MEALRTDFEGEAGEVRDAAGLEDVRARYLGRKRGRLTAVFDGMRNLPPESRGAVGRAANDAREAVSARLAEIEADLRDDAATESVALDVTLPGRGDEAGTLHPITLAMEEIVSVFTRMGYKVVGGPEVEHDFYNFEALNIPRDHPARDIQDTLYLGGDWLLRTHTSPVQIRTMQEQEPPLAIIVPGRVYRRDTPDATHTPSFVQCEGLLVDRDITMADLRGTLDHFAKALFGPQTETRLRPGYFPFTEPSAELDANAGDGWIEMVGCGMVHPAVFEAVGYDPQEWQGFAFGMGVDRIAALRYGINDIRIFYENDVRFLRQFAV
ncbi:MAG: phenylalanine--tRNA ligase subunit alpha [Acidobacteria bacterium]|nr:phenylalanine--tRNA ligase subunit alpha [Acidobacteriota bacterium]